MAELEPKTITISKTDAAQYVDAVEGLIFDPQPFKSDRPARTIEVRRSRIYDLLTFGAINKRQEPEPQAPDRVERRLTQRYTDFIAARFYELTQNGYEGNSREGTIRKYPSRARYYIENECPSLLVNGGSDREYIVDLQLVRDQFRIIYSSLGLYPLGQPSSGIDLLMCGRDMARIESIEDVDKHKYYIPAFAEQQRLIAINELQRKYFGSTQED